MEFGTETLDLVGYAASFIVLLSFFMKSINTLRTVNSVGCALFIVYGFLFDVPNLPIIITNVGILAVNGYYLFLKKEEPKVPFKEEK
ncbi:uroporphyrinogen decarboxylase [Nonlabens dokdonensis]|uniref:Uroporphyrinogen decarboxylase n=1 Tax=Nonlabens dokdonensis TaxID=328515 RepID=A0A1Z8AZI9_9FLAO|nr:uroporphyrinogen decarboxylase [Nonlabens dokdonensis]OUS15755.1 uroporphyrinogen decarboxylase [Nonlabens dokdonensis]